MIPVMTQVLEEKFEKLVDNLAANGYAVVDHFISDDEVAALLQEIRSKFEGGEFKRAGFGRKESYKVDDDVRGDHIHWIDREDLAGRHSYFNKIDELIRYINRTCYMGLKDYEMHFAIYPKGSHYVRHIDQLKNTSRRKLSVVCYLNPGWTERNGGNLKLYVEDAVTGEETTVNVLPVAGRLVCFESSKLEHEVEEATQDRYSITGWMLTEEA